MPHTQKKFNVTWFRERLAAVGLEQRDIAKHLRLDPSGVSLIVHNKRKLKPHEIPLLAGLLEVPIDEVMENAGIPTHGIKASDSVAIVGHVDSNMDVVFGDVVGNREAPPIGITGVKNLKALRMQTQGSAFEGMDGAILYYEDKKASEQATVGPQILGKLAIIAIENKAKDDSSYHLRVIKRGYSKETFNLFQLNGTPLEQDVAIKRCIPVLWMRF
jgi:hypothetical protein